MRRLILVLACIFLCWLAVAQKPTKEERKAMRAERRAEREEYYRIQDSLFWAEEHRQDSLRHIERKREGSTAVLAISPLSAPDAINTIARSLINAGFVIRVDKDYGTINTEPIWGNGASYTLHFVIEEHPQGCKAKGFAYAHGQVSAFSLGLGLGTSKTIDIRIEYGGHENSTTMIAFRALHNSISTLPDAEIEYIKE